MKVLKKRLVPELRFPEFSGEWEIKELNNICQINPKSRELPNEFIYIDLESVKDGLIDKDIKIIDKYEAPSRAQRLLEKGDILYQTVRPYQRNNLYFNFSYKKPVVASTGYAQLRCSKNYDKFIFQLLHTDKFVNAVLIRCTGTSYPAINSTELALINTNIPSIQEQTKIANFLTLIDNKIEKQEEKVINLEEYKNGMMQKIFSQEIRFKDEDGEDYPDWEETRLGDMVKLQGGYAFQSDSYKKIGIPIIRISNIDKRITVNKDITFYPNMELDERFTVTHGDLLIAMSGATTGKTGIYKEKEFAYLNQRVGKFVNINFNLYYGYLYHLVDYKEFKNQLNTKLVAGAQPNISPSDIESLIFQFPEIEEQEKLSNFLSSIDLKIEKEKEKLDYLRELKKGLIQKMFI